MDYKKYKNALEKAKVRYNEIKDTGCSEKEFLLDIFPELKESEDERIKKCISDVIKEYNREHNWSHIFGVTKDDCLAWLEKKGEQKPIMNVPTREVILAIWDLGNEWKELTNGSISTEYGTQLDYIQKHWHESEYYLRAKQDEKKVTTIDFNAKDWYVSKVDGKIHNINISSEKQGEQKPTYKVEPKFKVGDWIINDQGSAFQIAYIDTENCRYVFEIGGYTKEEMNYENIAFANNHYREWTIDDAKDGDILISKDNQPFIYNGKYDTIWVGAHCGMNCIGDSFYLAEEKCHWTGRKGVKPASKKQRELLSKKMKEAGYEWDAEKKELKLLISNGGDFESNNSKQKPTWSDKDEEILKNLIDYFSLDDGLRLPTEETIDWLKSLKDRVQPKKEWSKDDEKIVLGIEQVYNCASLLNIAPDKIDDVKKWLKSLKERLL